MKCTWPSIDHSLLSPSGHMSKRAREAAMKREHDLLFPPRYWDETPERGEYIRVMMAETLRRSALNLRDLAAQGMSTRKFTRKAEELEALAEELESAGG